MKKLMILVFLLSFLLNPAASVNAKNNEYNLENMKINYSEWYEPGSTHITISWETRAELQSLYISYVAPSGNMEFPINYPDDPFPNSQELNQTNPIEMTVVPPVPSEEDVEPKPYYYELKLLVSGRITGTMTFEFRYQLVGSEYFNTIYVNNTSYATSNPKSEIGFVDYLLIGFTIAVLISFATYLIMNASEKSIFTESENEEE